MLTPHVKKYDEIGLYQEARRGKWGEVPAEMLDARVGELTRVRPLGSSILAYSLQPKYKTTLEAQEAQD
jgi:hypothetical protein